MGTPEVCRCQISKSVLSSSGLFPFLVPKLCFKEIGLRLNRIWSMIYLYTLAFLFCCQWYKNNCHHYSITMWKIWLEGGVSDGAKKDNCLQDISGELPRQDSPSPLSHHSSIHLWTVSVKPRRKCLIHLFSFMANSILQTPLPSMLSNLFCIQFLCWLVFQLLVLPYYLRR